LAGIPASIRLNQLDGRVIRQFNIIVADIHDEPMDMAF
jgi:hypothetical protein